MLLNIYSCIKSQILTHTWHINISLNIYSYIKSEILTHIWHIIVTQLSVGLSVPVIDHQEPLPLPQNVEPGYHATVVHYERANTDVDPHVLKTVTT